VREGGTRGAGGGGGGPGGEGGSAARARDEGVRAGKGDPRKEDGGVRRIALRVGKG